MQTRPVIFVFSAVLLVPLIYATFSIPDVCALPPDPNWGKTGSCGNHDKENPDRLTCCWEEKDLYGGETITWCQDCDSGPSGATNCGPVYLKKPTTGPFGTSPPGVLQDPSTDSAPKVPGKGGFSFGPNLKSSQANVSSNDTSR